jgi:hypothetical protein
MQKAMERRERMLHEMGLKRLSPIPPGAAASPGRGLHSFPFPLNLS